MAPRLKEKYVSEIREALRAEFKHENVMQVGGLTKIVVNMGVGEAARDSKALEGAIRDLTAITGQKPVTTRAKKSIAQFKLREGQAIGAHVTLRGDRMWEFLDRLLSTALPRIRDFRGLSSKQFDGHGNYTFGLTEQSMFHEIDQDSIDRVRHGHHGCHLGHHRRRGSRPSASPRLPVQGGLTHGQDIPEGQGCPQAEVRRACLHPVQPLRPSALGVPQVRTVPRVPARARPPWRTPRCHQEQLVKRTSQVPGNRRNRDEEGE